MKFLYGGEQELIDGLTSCVSVKAYPTSIELISIQNPTGVIPKLVHVTCADNSNARTTLGWIIEAWFTPKYGFDVTTFTGGGNGADYFQPVQQTPTGYKTYWIDTSTIEIYRGQAATGHKWDTSTEYTIEIYT